MYGDRVTLGVVCLALITAAIFFAGTRLLRNTDPTARREAALWSWNTFAALALALMAMRLSSGTTLRVVLNNDVGPFERHILTVTTLLRVHSQICLCLFLCLAFMCSLALYMRSNGQRTLQSNLALNGTLLFLGLQSLALPRAIFGVEMDHLDPDFVRTSCSRLELYMSSLNVAALVMSVVAAFIIVWARRSNSTSTERLDSDGPNTSAGLIGWAVGGLLVLHLLAGRPTTALGIYESAINTCDEFFE